MHCRSPRFNNTSKQVQKSKLTDRIITLAFKKARYSSRTLKMCLQFLTSLSKKHKT